MFNKKLLFGLEFLVLLWLKWLVTDLAFEFGFKLVSPL